MEKCDILELKESILADNDADADKLRLELKDEDLFYINIMSSPGSGKTTTILQLLDALKDDFNIGVMEADIDSSVDAETVLSAGYPCVQLHTGGMCHLDADMSRQGIDCLKGHLKKAGIRTRLDAVILENVGNLVCPAEFDTGAHMNLVILSVPEGHDKPLKYPLVFEKCEAVIVNKTDALPVFDFDFEELKKGVETRNKDAKIFPISALKGEGIDAVSSYIKDRILGFKKG